MLAVVVDGVTVVGVEIVVVIVVGEMVVLEVDGGIVGVYVEKGGGVIVGHGGGTEEEVEGYVIAWGVVATGDVGCEERLALVGDLEFVKIGKLET